LKQGPVFAGQFVAAMLFAPLALADAPDAPASPSVSPEVSAILELSGDAAYGAYLAGECVTCHRASGGGAGIPPIAGLPADYLVTALVEYRSGARTNEVMVTTASRLGDAEIAALAAHFSELSTD
jgi:cytochrome c